MHNIYTPQLQSNPDLQQYPPELYLIRELSALKSKCSSLQDPSMSPASWSSVNMESLLTKIDKQSQKDAPPPAVDDILQRFVSLDVGAPLAFDKLAENGATKQGQPVHQRDQCGMETTTDKQLNRAMTPTHSTPRYYVKKGHLADWRKERSSSTGKVRRPLDVLRTSKALLANEKHIENKGLPLLGRRPLEGHNAGRQAQKGSLGKVEGAVRRSPYKKGRSPFSFEGKPMPRTRSSRKGRGYKRVGRSLSYNARRKVQQEVIYTGLITPLRRQRLHSSSPAHHALDHEGDWDDNGSGADELDICELPRNGCGTPWSWSRIHNKSRANILKMAEMSMPSCGSLDSFTKSTLRKALSHASPSSESTTESSDSTSSFNTDSESFPLLEPSPRLKSRIGSQSESGFWEKDIQDTDPAHKQLAGGGVSSGSESIQHTSLNYKYMPKSFHDIVGQNLITQALCNALSRGKIAPMYIFHGPRGTGKTSCAKIFAAALNCLSTEGQRPCGTCMECISGKNSVVKEFNVGVKNGTRGIKALMHDVIWSSSSHYNVYVVNECHTLTSQSWNAFLKVVEEAPNNIVFILSTSNLEQLPHVIVSRCQKFLFSKIKENEIINRLQLIALQEGMEADAEAFKLIASTCDGSLRDAEMMLDQLSLLGQKISISIVQELMGLIPDDKLVDLLDFALSADTVNTVRNLKELMVSGAEPLNLMSQLACLITSILAGGYQIPAEMQRGKFFRQELTKEDMERLRQALKTLSEAEKQLRDSSDRTTWLTAALLQFAPDQSYLVPRSSSNTSLTHTPEGPSDTNGAPDLSMFPKRKQKSHCNATKCASNGASDSSKFSLTALNQSTSTSAQATRENNYFLNALHSASSTGDIKFLSSSTQVDDNIMSSSTQVDDKFVSPSTQVEDSSEMRPHTTTLANQFDMEDVWQRFLDAVHSNSLRKFLMTQGKLVSLSLSKGLAVVLLEFDQLEHTSRAIRSRTSIAYAFHCTLGYPVDIKVCLAPAKEDQLRRQTLLGDRQSSSNSLWHSPWSAKNYNSHLMAEEHCLNTSTVDQPVFCMSSLYPLKAHQKSSLRSNLSFEVVESETGNSSSLLAMTTEKKKQAMENKQEGGELVASSSKVGKYKDKGALNLGLRRHVQDSSIDQFSQELHDDQSNEGVSSLNIFRSGGSDFGYTMAQQAHSAMVAAQLEEENMRLESKMAAMSCWSAVERKRGHPKVQKVHRTSKRIGLLLSLCPCAKSSHS